MDFFSLDIINFLQTYGYWAAFLTMVISGPVGAIASGFLSGIGFFDTMLIWLLAWGVDIGSDIFYYELGRRAGKPIFSKLSNRFPRLHKIREQIEWLFQRHGRKTILVIKFTHGFNTWTQMLAGMAHMSRKYFILINFCAGGIKTAILVAMGVAAGSAWQKWVGHVETIGLAVLGIVVISVLVLLLTIKLQARFIKKIQ